MDKDSVVDVEKRVQEESRTALDDVLREGARRMLQTAVEAEVSDYVEQHAELTDPLTGRRLVVRNGYQKERTIQSGLGDIPVTKPRVHDRRGGGPSDSPVASCPPICAARPRSRP